MKNTVVSFLAAVVLTVFLMSCVSMQDRMMTPQEQEQATIIDTVTDKITVFQLFHIPQKNRIKANVYNQLMKIARRKYQGDIEIRNITITSKLSGAEIALIAGSAVVGISPLTVHPILLVIGIPIALGINLSGNFQRLIVTGDVVAIGDVVLRDSTPSGSTAPVPANVPSNTPTPSNVPAPGKAPASGNAPAPGANF